MSEGGNKLRERLMRAKTIVEHEKIKEEKEERKSDMKENKINVNLDSKIENKENTGLESNSPKKIWGSIKDRMKMFENPISSILKNDNNKPVLLLKKNSEVSELTKMFDHSQIKEEEVPKKTEFIKEEKKEDKENYSSLIKRLASAKEKNKFQNQALNEVPLEKQEGNLISNRANMFINKLIQPATENTIKDKPKEAGEWQEEIQKDASEEIENGAQQNQSDPTIMQKKKRTLQGLKFNPSQDD
jgi:hypothetical protein